MIRLTHILEKIKKKRVLAKSEKNLNRLNLASLAFAQSIVASDKTISEKLTMNLYQNQGWCLIVFLCDSQTFE